MSVIPALLVDMLGKELLASALSFPNSLSGIIRAFALPAGGRFPFNIVSNSYLVINWHQCIQIMPTK